MFNNAGIGILGEARDHTIEDWYRIIDVNLRGVVNGVAAAYRVMLPQGVGHIVNTASVQGLVPTPLMRATVPRNTPASHSRIRCGSRLRRLASG